MRNVEGLRFPAFGIRPSGIRHYSQGALFTRPQLVACSMLLR